MEKVIASFFTHLGKQKQILMQSKDIDNHPLVEVVESDKNSQLTKENKKQLLIRDLEWTKTEAEETYYRFLSFKDDWDAPGIEAYDEL